MTDLPLVHLLNETGRTKRPDLVKPAANTEILGAYGFFTGYILPVASLHSLVCGALSILVFLRLRLRLKRINVLFYTTIVLADIGCTLFLSVSSVLGDGASFLTSGAWYFYVEHISVLVCRLWRLPWLVFESVSSLTLTFFAVERCFAVKKPLQSRSIFTYRRSASAVVTIVLLAFFFHALCFHAWDIIKAANYPGKDCVPALSFLGTFELMVDLFFFFYFFPIVIQTTSNLVVLIVLRKNFSTRKLLSVNSRADHQKHNLKLKDLSASVTLLCLCVAYLMVAIPAAIVGASYVIIRAYRASDESPTHCTAIHNAYVTLCELAGIVRSFYFYVYYVTMAKFRFEFQRILKTIQIKLTRQLSIFRFANGKSHCE